MNSRVEIKVVVLGEESAGKETFGKMLFVDNGPKIRVDPLSKLAQLYVEIDPLNFPASTKKITDECQQQNNLIMHQSKISSIKQLRDNNVDPLFYRYTKRIPDLINYDNKENRINKNIMLNFYFIGSNYLDFTKEINDANILIFITDINKSSLTNTDNEMFHYLVNLIKKSNNKKYLLTIVNKCDSLNANGEFDSPVTSESKTFGQIDQTIREYATDGNMHQNMLPPIAISSKYSCIYRQLIHMGLNDIPINDKLFITNMFVVKKENIIKDINRDKNKYLKRSGFIAFRDILADILNTKYRIMVDHNFETEIQAVEEKILELNNKSITEIKTLRTKANRLAKIFKKDYQTEIINLVRKILNNMLLSAKPNLYIVDYLKEMYEDDVIILPEICATREKIYLILIEKTGQKLYNNDLTSEIFLPTKVYPMFSDLHDGVLTQSNQKINCSENSSKHISQLATHICELYSFKARQLLYTDLELLFSTYFVEQESLKLIIMLSEIQSMLRFETYKNYLTQIWLTKLMVANQYINNSHNNNCINTVIAYCKSLKYSILNTKCKKYDYLFSNICDICTSLTLKIDIASQLTYISENINDIIDFKTCKLIELDNFIIKRLQKTNYQSMIKTGVGSDADSDDEDFYDSRYDINNLDNDDMDSGNEEDPISDTLDVNQVKKKTGIKKVLVEV